MYFVAEKFTTKNTKSTKLVCPFQTDYFEMSGILRPLTSYIYEIVDSIHSECNTLEIQDFWIES